VSKKIAVIGAGKWGSALNFALSFKNKTVITSRTKRDIANFVSLEEALKHEFLVISISTQHTHEWLKNNFVFNNQKILVASKGIDLKTKSFLDEIYENFIPKENLCYLSGPSFAKEVMEQKPTALVISSINYDLALLFSSLFPEFIKTYISDDIKGAEIAGAYKNVIAIASGICDALNLGNNARAALITRGLAEMTRFGLVFGAKTKSFLGLSGVGDLFLTATSTLSRNYRVGFGLGENKKLKQILQEINEVAEGVATTKAIVEIAKEKNIYTPIANEVNEMILGKKPQKSLKNLLKSTKKEEF
jgi:glycerol-3-phosphate dehydrogenase (NAD(P)+)